MPLDSGSRLGPYEILGPLGAGGMGEVYKARDTRLDRTVAIKVLPSHLSDHPDLRQRFEREAKAISSLSHAHICALYDVGHQDGVDFLVMELLEGETLAQRLTRGAVPAEQVLKFGLEIANALEAAHRQGIVHRDLKPANIMLTRAGVKLLDFGLAKTAVGPATSGATALTSLPTEALGGQPLTTEGTLLGTFQYMAPEQLEGKEADARTDLFAFGAVLYEMATGRAAFQARSRASLISAIMSADPPPISSLQPLTPPALERVVRTCLAKEPDDRWQTAHDVALQLEWIAEGGSQAGLPAPVAARRRGRERIAWIAAAALALGLGALAAVVLLRRAPEPYTMRLEVSTSPGISSVDLERLSPDGRFIALNATDSTGTWKIWLRPLNSLEAQPMPGTEGTSRPFWSPDSRFIGFVANGKLRKVPVAGGPPQTICDAPTGSDGAWGSRGVILFDGQATDPIRRAAASGGVATTQVPIDSGAVAWPHFLPDGRHFLYIVLGRSVGEGDIAVGDLDSKQVRRLGIRGSRVEYAPPGYLLYVRERTLLAQPFDARALKVVGEPVPVAENVPGQGNGYARFSVSDNGGLVYSRGSLIGNRFAWFDRTGRLISQVGPPGNLLNFSLSPDEKRIAVRRADETGNRDVWIFDTERGTATRLTFDPANDNQPLWSPDGSRIAFSSTRPPGGGGFQLYWKMANGVGAEDSLLVTPASKFPTDWSRDGGFMLFDNQSVETDNDIWVMPMTGEHKPRPYLATHFAEGFGRFSPDGRWVAYTSNESGGNEVYVQPFPGPGGKWQVSTHGGYDGVWSADGKELFYIGTDQKLMSVPIKTGETFEAGVPQALFGLLTTSDSQNHYAVSKDGQRFLVLGPEHGGAPVSATLVLNWSAELTKR